jgi:hypothetical protein
MVMPLIECPECRKGVSDMATACPYCGHPIAGYGNYDPTAAERAHRLLRDQPTDGNVVEKKGNRGCSGAVVLMLIGIVVLIAIGSNKEAADKANPTCKTDWRLCADNSDLINNFGDITRGQSYCKIEAEKLAKYGSPKWPWLAFSTFYTGKEYVKTGIATLVEKDAQFSNAFGAMVHSTVTCRYDLNLQKVLDARVAPN